MKHVRSRNQTLIRLISFPPPMDWAILAVLASRGTPYTTQFHIEVLQIVVHTPVLQGVIWIHPSRTKVQTEAWCQNSLLLHVLILLPDVLQIFMIRWIDQCTRLSAILLQGHGRIAFCYTGLRAKAQPQPSVKLSLRHLSTALDAWPCASCSNHCFSCPNSVCLSIFLLFCAMTIAFR